MSLHAEEAFLCRPHLRPVNERVELSGLAKVVAAKDRPAILGGNASVRGMSVFAAEPVEVFEFSLNESNPFEKLKAFLSRYRLATKDDLPFPSGFFCGGWIGYFGYELGRFIERLPQHTDDDIGMPIIRLAFYDKAILFNHSTGAFSLVAVKMEGTPSVDAKFTTLNNWLNEANANIAPLPAAASIDTMNPAGIACTMTQTEYFAALEQIHRHIIDGDVYQINYSQRFSMPFNGQPVDLFCWQNHHNPSPYAAYLAWDETAVVSASPELFLDVRGDHICTDPIKGTRPRNPALPDDAPANRRQFAALVKSEKDQAELAMIIDLERNDLARVCMPGTRHVSCLRRIEAFATVYHAVGTVEGRLSLPPGTERIEALLRATFPGGSITGAPKISAMEIIDALEPTACGVYTGSIGWIGLNFDLCLNIAIRTIILQNDIAYVQTGGGIVADSDPQAEWNETLIKARALLAGIRAINSNIQI
jgi:para-aminobenzoate synthetase component 1